jgi:hypothetical protein
MGKAMDQTITELAAAQFHRQLLEEDLAQIEWHQSRCLQNLYELCVSQSDHNRGVP